MLDRYSSMPPEEQRIIVATLLGVAATLWLAIAWEEVMVLVALPALAVVAWVLMRAARRRAQRREEEWLF